MSTQTDSPTDSPTARALFGPTGQIWISWAYIFIDARRQLRNRRTMIFLAVMPVMIFVAFGSAYRSSDPVMFSYIMVSMAVYGAMVAMTSIGASTSTERGQGWTRQLRLTPLHPAGYVVSKVIVALLLGVIPVALVLAVGAGMGARLSAAQWLEASLASWVCSLVFAAFGLFMGYLIPAENVMQFIGPLLAMLSFFGGLFTPVAFLPHALRVMAPYMPTYAVGEIARSPITGTGFTLAHVTLLLIWTAAFSAGTAFLFRRDTARG